MNRRFILVLILCISVFATSIRATEIAPEQIRSTGIITTTEVVELGNEQSIYYDLALSGNQEATVKFELFDPIYTDPERVPITYLVNHPIDNNIFSISAFLISGLTDGDGYRIYETNSLSGKPRSDITMLFQRITKDNGQGIMIPENHFNAGGTEERVKEFYLKKYIPRKTNDKLYLKLTALWSYSTMRKYPTADANRLKVKVIISKSGNRFLAAKCNYLKYLPGFIYRFFTGGSNCVVDISNENVSLTNTHVSSSPTPSGKNETSEIGESALTLIKLLAKPDYDKLVKSKESNPNFYKDSYCKFSTDPYSSKIPLKAREVYTWSSSWNPKNYPENYVECVAFVQMVYNMNGKPLPHDLGDPVAWLMRGDVFTIYESGKAKELPQTGDIMIWASTSGNPHGHVGVVYEVDFIKKVIKIANANSNETIHQYDYKNSDDVITLAHGLTWKPKYWLRLKK